MPCGSGDIENHCMSFANSTQTRIADFLRKLENSGAAARSFASITALKAQPALVSRPPGSEEKRLFSVVENVFKQGLINGIKGHDKISTQSNGLPPELMGVLCEGTAMGLAMLDMSTSWQKKDRWREFLNGDGARHVYEVHVGLGLALAQMALPFENRLDELDEQHKWLVVDGYAFHKGVFKQEHAAPNAKLSSKLFKHAYSGRAFDQGLGRSLWFVHSASADDIARSITSFATNRQGDLWSGIGIAAAHAGGIDSEGLHSLKAHANKNAIWLAYGAAFAAKIREYAGTQAQHTDMACQIFCNMSASEAAIITDRAQENLPSNTEAPSYEIWRQRISQHFTK
jgi:hypothetical protein